MPRKLPVYGDSSLLNNIVILLEVSVMKFLYYSYFFLYPTKHFLAQYASPKDRMPTIGMFAVWH